MPAHQKVPLRPLFPLEEQELQRIGKATSERQDRARRAQALLAVATGQTFSQAAATTGFKSGDSVAQLVARFNQWRSREHPYAPNMEGFAVKSSTMLGWHNSAPFSHNHRPTAAVL